MKTYLFNELNDDAQANAINLCYADSDYQNFIAEVQNGNPDECPLVGDWACEKGLTFNELGERTN